VTGQRPAGSCGSCGGMLPSPRRSYCSDKCRRRFNREERVTDNSDFADGLTRLIGAYGRRIADNDTGELERLARMRGELDRAITAAVAGLRGHGRSWAEIGAGLGITRQSAHERFGRQDTLTPDGPAASR